MRRRNAHGVHTKEPHDARSVKQTPGNEYKFGITYAPQCDGLRQQNLWKLHFSPQNKESPQIFTHVAL